MGEPETHAEGTMASAPPFDSWERKLLSDLNRPRRRVVGWFLLFLSAGMFAGMGYAAWWMERRMEQTFGAFDDWDQPPPAVEVAKQRLRDAGLIREAMVLQTEGEKTAYAQGLLSGRVSYGLLMGVFLSTVGIFAAGLVRLGWGTVGARDRLLAKLKAALARREDVLAADASRD